MKQYGEEGGRGEGGEREREKLGGREEEEEGKKASREKKNCNLSRSLLDINDELRKCH
jgi:hypothetical protein